MRIIVDQQLPPVLANWLRGQDEDANHVREIGLRDSADREIWRAARERDALLISKDEDFVVLHSSDPSVRLLWVRIGNCDNAELLRRFENRWPAVLQRFEAGERLVELR